MNQVWEFFSNLFNTNDWPARWHCGKWTHFHGWLYIISDVGIWAAYFAIPLLIVNFILRRTDLPFPKVFWLFASFILLCGLTHLMDAVIFWWPAYRLSAAMRFITAIVSISTVYATFRILPVAVALKSPKILEKEIEERIKAEQKVGQLNKELEKRIAQLQEFAYITSHNLRSPICSLTTLIDLYKEEESEEVKVGLVSDMDKISGNMTRMLDELAGVVKVSGEGAIPSEKIKFNAMFEGVRGVLAGQLQESQADLQGDFSFCSSIEYPSAYLESILLNLISNSIKYRSPDRKPVILVRSYTNDGEVFLTVQDNGLGIDLDQYGKRVFGLYKTFHHHPEAKGLGLFMVKTQIESLGGSIAVDSKPDAGSTFIVNFGKRATW